MRAVLWANVVTRPLYRFRFAVVASFLFLSSLHPRLGDSWWPLACVPLLAAISLFSYLFLPKTAGTPEGKLARRRLMEGAAAALLAIDLAARTWPQEWLPYLTFPFFLVLVYAGYRWREIAALLVLQGALSLFHAPGGKDGLTLVVSTYLFLVIWTALASVFRLQERKKRKGVLDRLQLYEREASLLEGRSAEMESVLRAADRKKAHLAEMIRGREKSFRNLLEIVQRTYEPHTCALYLFDEMDEVFVLKDHFTRSDRFSKEPVRASEGIFQALRNENAPIRLFSSSKPLRGLTYYEGPAPVQSVLVAPLRTEDSGQLKGALVLDRLEPTPFADDECETVIQIGRQLNRAIENAEALHAYFHLKEELSNFYSASTALNRSLRVEDVVQTLVQSTHEIVHYDWSAVVLYDAESDENRITAEGGETPAGCTGATFVCAPERGLVSWVVKNQTPLSYTHFRLRQGKTTLFPKSIRVPPIFDSVLLLPLQMKGEPLGAILFASRKNNAFSKSVRKMLEVVALQAASSLKNARMVQELERRATTDGLTGLANHRTFQEFLSTELERSGRHPSSTTLLLADIDHFKKFNDEYGHPVGDFVLREIGGVLRKMVRKIDLVARYGGEEFAVILVGTPGSGGYRMAERIVEAVAKTRFVRQGLTLRVTLSVGLAEFPDDSESREDLIEKADRALYESKRAGRNRATAYHAGLGKMESGLSEAKLIAVAEEEVRKATQAERRTRQRAG
ncbi:MAG TPA: diguanylate cyclase [Bdellovibrionota bacterium]|nr:diguanylate cyclase [Bdellovibrionota bacterium]